MRTYVCSVPMKYRSYVVNADSRLEAEDITAKKTGVSIQDVHVSGPLTESKGVAHEEVVGLE